MGQQYLRFLHFLHQDHFPKIDDIILDRIAGNKDEEIWFLLAFY